jgi:hypothetical protein
LLYCSGFLATAVWKNAMQLNCVLNIGALLMPVRNAFKTSLGLSWSLHWIHFALCSHKLLAVKRFVSQCPWLMLAGTSWVYPEMVAGTRSGIPSYFCLVLFYLQLFPTDGRSSSTGL